MKDGKLPNKIVQLTGKQTVGPHVLISAGVHGDEYEPMLAIQALTEILGGMLLKGTVTLMPIVNVGAYLSENRLGMDGLDLARICPGNATGSDSQQAAAEVSLLIREADYYIDLHTGGRLFDIFPLAGYMLHPDADVLEKQRKMAGTFGLPVVWGTEAKPEGRTLSVARDARVPAIYVEYGGGGLLRKEVKLAYLQGCMRVLAWLNMVEASEKAIPQITYWVEDNRPSGGYLQGKMPAPMTGIFECHVSLGDRVKKGAPWGSLYDPIHGEIKEIEADMDGIVLFVRKAPFVRKAEALGGILPITEPGKQFIDAKP